MTMEVRPGSVAAMRSASARTASHTGSTVFTQLAGLACAFIGLSIAERRYKASDAPEPSPKAQNGSLLALA